MGSSSQVEVDGRVIGPAQLAAICARHEIAERAMFGSRARGDAEPGSEVDVLYVLEPGRHLGFAINRLEDELVELFGRPVDLVSRKAVHPRLRDKVISEARTLYAA